MNVSQFIEWLATNPWLIITGFIITVISLPLAIIFYIKSKKDKKLYYAKASHNLVRDLVSRIDSLEMLYDGKRIENLTATKIAFWNAGNDTIKPEHIPKDNPLVVGVKEEYEILNAKIVYPEKETQFSIPFVENKPHIQIKFEYLDKNQGLIIQLLHTGKSNLDVGIDGYIMGFGKPEIKDATNVLDSRTVLLLVCILSIPAWLIFIAATGSTTETTIYDYIALIFYITPFLLIAFVIYNKYILPKGFEKFQDEILK